MKSNETQTGNNNRFKPEPESFESERNSMEWEGERRRASPLFLLLGCYNIRAPIASKGSRLGGVNDFSPKVKRFTIRRRVSFCPFHPTNRPARWINRSINLLASPGHAACTSFPVSPGRPDDGVVVIYCFYSRCARPKNGPGDRGSLIVKLNS